MDSKNGVVIARSSSLEEMATECFLALKDDDLSPADWKAWADWLQGCEEHQKAFDNVVRLWDQLDFVLPIEVPSPAEMAADKSSDGDGVPHGSGNPVHVDRKRRRGFGPFDNLAHLAIAASIVFAVILGSLQFGWLGDLLHDKKILETRVSQTMKANLIDGSKIFLDGDTRIEVDFSKQFRRVTLVRGRAFFEVSKDAARPFIVNAGNGDTTAVGTRFEVNKLSNLVSVTVTEGLVKVSSVVDRQRGAYSTAGPGESTLIGVGEQVRYSYQDGLQKIKHVNAHSVGLWRNGLLTLIDESLCQAIEEVNRYAPRRIYYRDDEICDLNISGTVNLSQPEEWLAGLEKGYPLKVIPAGQNGLLLSRIREGDIPRLRTARR